LPFDLDFDDSQSTMLAKVGVRPAVHEDADLQGFALWHFPHFSLHVQYSNLENVLYRITIMQPGYWKPLGV
jgi:hypothetical protein